MVGLAAPPADDKDTRQARRGAAARGSRMSGGGGGGATSLSRQRAATAPGGNAALVVVAACHGTGRTKGRGCKVRLGRTRCRGVGETKRRREGRQNPGRGEDQQKKGNNRRQRRARRTNKRPPPTTRGSARPTLCAALSSAHLPCATPHPRTRPVPASTLGERGVPEAGGRDVRASQYALGWAREDGEVPPPLPLAPHSRGHCVAHEPWLGRPRGGGPPEKCPREGMPTGGVRLPAGRERGRTRGGAGERRVPRPFALARQLKNSAPYADHQAWYPPSSPRPANPPPPTSIARRFWLPVDVAGGGGSSPSLGCPVELRRRGAERASLARAAAPVPRRTLSRLTGTFAEPDLPSVEGRECAPLGDTKRA